MKLKTIIISALIFGLSFVAKAQNTGYSAWSEAELQKANTARSCTGLTEVEKEVILLTNLVRIDGEKFRESFAKPYLKGKMNGYISSLYSQLEHFKDLPMLYPDAKLCNAARYHAKEMGESGNIGHSSLDGTSFDKRLKKFGYPSNTYMAENCSYGFNDAIGIVMQLLVDEGVPGLGHRKNILSSNYKAIGVSVYPHQKHKYTCVQDFGERVSAPMTEEASGNQSGNETQGTSQGGFTTEKASAKKGFSAWSEYELLKANTAKNCPALSEEEKNVILLLNLARIDGKKFGESFVRDYFPDESGQTIESLYADLEKMSDYPMLTPDSLLCRGAKNHAMDIGRRGVISHQSADGTESYERMKRLGYQAGSQSETLHVGDKAAIDIVMQLLIDKSFSTHPNREILLSKSYKAIGVSICPHSQWEHCCVMVFGSWLQKPLKGGRTNEH